MSVSPARQVAYAVLRRVFEQGAFADRALHSAAASLGARDRALATALVYGTVQRRRTLDHVLGRLSSTPPAKLDLAVLAALRLGLYQLLLMGGISDYAAVNESVELAKRSSHGGGLVNAVLRRAGREGAALVASLDDHTAAHAAVLHSVPDWLAELWWHELGAERARALLACVNTPAESAIRVNPLRATVEQVRAHLTEFASGCVVSGAPVWERGEGLPGLTGLPEVSQVLVLDGPFDAFGCELFKRGAIMPQARASAVVAQVLAPRPGDRVLDLCAAPGAKTTHLAALMHNTGELTAVEAHTGRAGALTRTCRQMGAEHVNVVRADARRFESETAFDRVLVDPPCSGLGTLQSRPDLRWQPHREQLGELARRQLELLRAGAAALRPGGRLVYSVCTISKREGDAVIDAFLDGAPEFACAERWQLLPSVDGTDGFFIAAIERG